MKGVIIKYKSEQGFGFIGAEDGNSYFFHISDVIDKNFFLENYQNFYFREIGDTCQMINFDIGKNTKGPCAINIRLTEEKINDRKNMEIFAAEITDIKNEIMTWTRTVSGIKKGDTKPFFATAGGNGTFRLGYPETSRELFLKFKRTDGFGNGMIEVREQFLNINDRQKIMHGTIKSLENKIKNKIVQVTSNGKDWILANSEILKI